MAPKTILTRFTATAAADGDKSRQHHTIIHSVSQMSDDVIKTVVTIINQNIL